MTFCLLFVCLFARESDVSLRRSIAEEGRNVSFAVLSAEQCQWVFASNIAVFGLFVVVVVVVLSIVKKRILSVFRGEML